METKGIVIALLIVAIVFSVISIVFLMGIGDLSVSVPSAPITAQAVQGHQSGNVVLNILGGAP